MQPTSKTIFSNIETKREFDHMEVLHTRFHGRRFPLHFHDTFVIQYIVAGTDKCSATGLAAHQHQVFVHTPHAAHSGGPETGDSLEYRAIYPSQKLATDLLGKHSDFPPISFVSQCDQLRCNLNRFFEASNKGEQRRLLSKVIERVCEIARVETTEVEKSLSNTKGETFDELKSARDYLIDNCRRDVSTDELSRISHLSRFHLIREFKRRYGITPRQFLISQRVLLAKKLISGGEAIAAVALQVGFADQSHLSRCFKRVSGFNPGQYAKG